MSTVQWILSIVLLGWALTRNLGTRQITLSTFVLPIVIVVVVGGYFLRAVPTQGNDLALILAGGAIGAAFGLAAGAATRLHHRDGKVVATAGAMFAALWIAMIVGRIAFAEWANGAGPAPSVSSRWTMRSPVQTPGPLPSSSWPWAWCSSAPPTWPRAPPSPPGTPSPPSETRSRR